MKRFALLLFLSLFVSGMALSDGQSRAVSQIPFNWTVHNDPSSYHWICAARGTAGVSDGIAATWTLPSRITRIEYPVHASDQPTRWHGRALPRNADNPGDRWNCFGCVECR